ncbi:MAG: hypothetical protein CMH60_03940 [Myxococcales bacterium]|nr:hypothetical protein [Myxococcales bacterium]
MKTKTFSKGFTLIELTISVGIAALLATGVMAGKGFINATHLSKQGQAIERTRMTATNFLMQRATQMDPGALEDLDLIRELSIRQLIPKPSWESGDITLSSIRFDMESRLLVLVTKGPAKQLNALTEYHTSHALFENRPPEHLDCAHAKRPIPTHGVGAIKLCFQTSL